MNRQVSSTPASELSEDIDFNDFADFNPHLPLSLEAQYQLTQDEEKPQPPPVAQRGIPRMVAMLLLTGGVIIVGLSIWQFVKPKSDTKPPVPTTAQKTKEPLLKDEKPELLARLAYVDQQKLIAQTPKSNEPTQREPKPSPTPKATPKPTPHRVVERPPAPRIVATRPPVRPTAPPPTPRTIVRTVTVPAPAPKPAPTLTSTPEKLNPFERWNQLAQLGQTRGNVEVETEKSPVTQNLPIPTKDNSANQDSKLLTVNIGKEQPPETPLASRQLSSGTIGILNRTPQPLTTSNTLQIALGTITKGTVSVPLLWDTGSGEQLYNRFAITLTEDVLATNGSVALNKGTVIIAQANHVGKKNLMVQASAIAIVYTDESGKVKQQEIPSGAILIAGEDGTPLIAKGHLDSGDDIAKQDLFVGLLSGIGRVGEVFTQPRTTSSTSINSGGFNRDTITVENREPQIWSAVLDGFFSPLAKRLERRSQRAVEELLSRPNIAMVPKGTKVSVTVNSFLTISR
ncbi:TrbI/VirB10 family protein [Floridanema evergladense]|uniref:TrbI/VirB10 family protein n=1 Tax=Floridaenema evergladense BLCC-F167 TaxID=3153639 RepID=A0ABV4WW59_9CYAN